MSIQPITPADKDSYNTIVTHPLQSYEWGQFREKSGIKVIRRGFFEKDKVTSGFQLTIHKIPKTPWTIGYLPKGSFPTKEMLRELHKIGDKEKCLFIQLEPDVIKNKDQETKLKDLGLTSASHPLFTKYTFVLDLTKTEEELLKNMHQKARYNIRVAQKHDVEVVEDDSDKAFAEYLKLTKATTERQGFFAHTAEYHRLMWSTLRVQNSNIEIRNSEQIPNTNDKKNKSLEHSNLENLNIVSDFGFRASDLNQLTAHLLVAKFKGQILTTWIVFTFKDTLYYPYGASSSEHREVMASNLMMWEAIRFGKKLGLSKFDMWGALGPNADKNDPWYGFHSFKERYGPELTEFIGSYDLVINTILYQGYKVADKLRWLMLRFKKS